MEAVLTIEPPPRASMCEIACLQPMNWPFRLTATSRSKTAMSRVTMSVSTALVEESVALLCKTSRPPLGGNSVTEFAGHALGLSPVDIGDHHRGTFVRHQTRGGLADAAAGTGDDRDLVLRASHVGFTITLIDSRSFIAR